MKHSADVIVAGLGAMGSATAWHLSRRGIKVLGFDKFHPPHGYGSSHGHARVIREAYARGPAYVPLIRRAIQIWSELGDEVGEELFRIYGHLSMRRGDDTGPDALREIAMAFGIPLEVLSAEEIRMRFPMFRPEDNWTGIYEPWAGAVFPERCIQTCLTAASRGGADLHFDEPILSWRGEGNGIEVRTDSGTFGADRLVITAGAWVGRLTEELGLPVTIERLTLYMFEPARNGESLRPGACPNSSWGCGEGPSFYCQPDFGHGFKAAFHHGKEGFDPERPGRSTTEKEDAEMRDLVTRYIPDAAGRIVESTACLYTNMPDLDWVIDCHPEDHRVIVGSPCSGHGFKFASAIGEILADLTMDRNPEFDLSPFRISRFDSNASREEKA